MNRQRVVRVKLKPSSASSGRNVAPASICPDCLILGDPHGPVVEIRRCGLDEPGTGESIPLTDTMRLNLSSLMSHAPGLALNEAVMSSNVYRLVASLEVSRGLMNGSLEVVSATDGGYRSTVRATFGNKQYSDHVSYHRIRGVNLSTAALGIWQVMAVVTAQKFLSDINRQLARLEHGVREIRDWLESGRRGKIAGNLKYLRHVADALTNQTLTEVDTLTFNQQLEEIERECGQIMEDIGSGLNLPVQEFKALKLGGAGRKEHLQQAEECIFRFERIAHPYLQALYVRAVACQLMCALPVTRSVAQARLEELRDVLAEQEERHTAFRREVERRLPELKGSWVAADEGDQECQKQLRDQLNQTLDRLGQPANHMRGMISTSILHLAAQMSESRKPVSFDVTLDDTGWVSALRRAEDRT